MTLKRYPYVTGANTLYKVNVEAKNNYDPFEYGDSSLFARAFSYEADVLNSEYSQNESTWD